MINISQVLAWKFTGIDWRVEGTVDNPLGEIVRFEGGIPSKVDQSAWSMEYEAYLASIAYVGGRIEDYKPLAEQLDMLYWDKVNGTDTWKFHIDAVKAANPKPE